MATKPKYVDWTKIPSPLPPAPAKPEGDFWKVTETPYAMKFVTNWKDWKGIFGSNLITKEEPKNMLQNATTQKARSVAMLPLLVPQFRQTYAIHGRLLEMDGNSLTEATRAYISQKWGEDIFVRPCPETPQHGFLESRRMTLKHVSSQKVYADLRKMYRQMQEIDPKSELLLTNYVRAAYNMVMANGSITIGAYHDGATANRKAIVIPTTDIVVKDSTLLKAGVTNSPFIELVASKSSDSSSTTPYITQLRDGPKLPRVRDYVPYDVKVQQVIVTNPATDLLAFKDLAKGFAKGTVVYGNGLNSHAGIHCSDHNIPFITSHVPEVGELIPQMSFEKKECNRAAFIEGAEAGIYAKLAPFFGSCVDEKTRDYVIDSDLCNTDEASRFVLFVFHSVPFFDLSDPVQARLLGTAATIAARLAMAACIGESRYATSIHKRDKTVSLDKAAMKERNEVYDFSFNSHIIDVLRGFVNRAPLFGWTGWGSGVGGPKWHVCSIVTARLWNAIVEYCDDDATGSVENVVEALNAVINVSHNGAKLLTKFANPTHFNDAASEKLPFMAANITGTLYKAGFNRLRKLRYKTEWRQIIPEMLPEQEVIERRIPWKAQDYHTLDDAIMQLRFLKGIYAGVGGNLSFSVVAKKIAQSYEAARPKPEIKPPVDWENELMKLRAEFETRFGHLLPLTYRIAKKCGGNCRYSLVNGAYMATRNKDGKQALYFEFCAHCNRHNGMLGAIEIEAGDLPTRWRVVYENITSTVPETWPDLAIDDLLDDTVMVATNVCDTCKKAECECCGDCGAFPCTCAEHEHCVHYDCGAECCDCGDTGEGSHKWCQKPTMLSYVYCNKCDAECDHDFDGDRTCLNCGFDIPE